MNGSGGADLEALQGPCAGHSEPGPREELERRRKNSKRKEDLHERALRLSIAHPRTRRVRVLGDSPSASILKKEARTREDPAR